MVNQIRDKKFDCILGVNIGPNKGSRGASKELMITLNASAKLLSIPIMLRLIFRHQIHRN